MTAEALREKYREARRSMGLTLRDAALLLNVPVMTLSLLEHGPQEPFEVDKTSTVRAVCHHCHEMFDTHPVIRPAVVFPSYVCPRCRQQEESDRRHRAQCEPFSALYGTEEVLHNDDQPAEKPDV
jgi:hypothetical protein